MSSDMELDQELDYSRSDDDDDDSVESLDQPLSSLSRSSTSRTTQSLSQTDDENSRLSSYPTDAIKPINVQSGIWEHFVVRRSGIMDLMSDLIATKKRNRLDPKRLSKLTFLHHNERELQRLGL